MEPVAPFLVLEMLRDVSSWQGQRRRWDQREEKGNSLT